MSVSLGFAAAVTMALCRRLQVQQGRDEVMLEFPVDDTAGAHEDALVEMSFHVPREVEAYPGDDDTPSCKVRAGGLGG
jgi:Structure-specific recognition protein (SSRP1)